MLSLCSVAKADVLHELWPPPPLPAKYILRTFRFNYLFDTESHKGLFLHLDHLHFQNPREITFQDSRLYDDTPVVVPYATTTTTTTKVHKLMSKWSSHKNKDFMVESGGWVQEVQSLRKEAAVWCGDTTVDTCVCFGRWQQSEQAAAGSRCCLLISFGLSAVLQECNFPPWYEFSLSF